MIVTSAATAGKGVPMSRPTGTLPQLMAVIEDRKARRPPGSYTARLLDGGVDAVAAKLREEAHEVVQAAGQAAQPQQPEQTRQNLVHEAADLVYHLLVMLACCNVSLPEVEVELARRLGTSGLEEKASRGKR